MVNNGYKKTEIGLIPEDWELCSIEHNFDFYQNNTYSRDCMNDVSGTVCNIHYGDVLIKYGAILECDKEDIPFINPEISVNTINRTIQSGDIIMSDTAEDDTVGKAVEVVNVGNKTIVAGLHTFFIRPHANLFAQRYLGYFINSPVYHDQLLPHIVGTKVSSISKKSLAETFVLRPPIPEQEAIAEALSDIDNLIANLEKLIAKKKAIKKGAMQDLFTGKKRLPGFEGEWVQKSFYELYEYASEGGTPSTRVPEYYSDGSIPFVKIEHLSKKYIYSVNSYISEQGLAHSSAWIIPVNSIIFSNGATIGEVSINKIPVCTKQGILGIVPAHGVSFEFLYYYLSTDLFSRKVREVTTQGTMSVVYLKDLKNISVFFPPHRMNKMLLPQFLVIWIAKSRDWKKNYQSTAT